MAYDLSGSAGRLCSGTSPSLFVSDIRSALRYASGMVFADNTQIYRSVPVSQLNEGLARMNQEVNVISEYAVRNGLTLNIKTSKILILGSNAYVSQINFKNLPITINNFDLPYVSE